MEELQAYHDILIKNTAFTQYRFLFHQINWSSRMIAIKGPRGTGKTTIMLQRIKECQTEGNTQVLYITMEHPYFYNHSLFDFVQIFYKYGGRYLFVDEVHKYQQWSRELKVIHDGYSDLQIVFSASSALDLYRGEADLSRRIDSYFLPGLSFREYLSFNHHLEFSVIPLSDLSGMAREISITVTDQIVVLPIFQRYLRSGYYPFHLDLDDDSYIVRLTRIINTIIESDLAYIDGYSTEAAGKVKKILRVIAESVPFKPNISSISRKTQVSRDLIYTYLIHLQKAHLLQFLRQKGKGISTLQKPDKLFLENTNLSFALKPLPDKGNMRETFLLNQLINAGYQVFAPPQGDFYVEEPDLIIEVGGQGKGYEQIYNLPHGLLAIDDLERSIQKKIPLWLFGFLY